MTDYKTYEDDVTFGKKCPSLEGLEYVSGDKVTIEAGKTYVILFWAKWDKGGHPVIESVSALKDKPPDVVFVGISTDPDKPSIQRFLDKKEYRMNFAACFD